MDQVPAVERATPDGLYVEHGLKPFGGLEVAGRGGWAARQGVGEHAGAELVDDLTGGVVVHVGHRESSPTDGTRAPWGTTWGTARYIDLRSVAIPAAGAEQT